MSALLSVLLAAGPSGTATVPLDELMNLVQPKEGVAAAPVAGVTTLTLAGRPGEAGLWLEVEANVRVLSGDAVPVRLLEVSADTVVESLPDTADAVVTLKDGAVTAICQGVGAHRLVFKLLVRATREGRRATVRFETSSLTPPTPLKLDVDDSLFELPGATVVREWGGYVVFPTRHVYQVTWASRQEQQKPQVAQRAPVDPLVKDATSRWVMTLEGRATHEVKLTLQLDRPGVMKLEAPQGQRVLRARVNGVPMPVEDGARALAIEVTPASLGAAEAVVELALAQDFGVFHLSGALDLAAPVVSWPVSRWTTEAVLPRVFTWERRGGSMEQMGTEAEAHGDVPGKALFFTQHLITMSGPMIALGYSVDLRGSYFR